MIVGAQLDAPVQNLSLYYGGRIQLRPYGFIDRRSQSSLFIPLWFERACSFLGGFVSRLGI